MVIPRHVRIAFGVALLVCAALAVGLVRGYQNKQRQRESAAATAKKLDGPDGERAKKPPSLSSEEFRERLRRLHPGMDISEEIEEAIDVTALPLWERRQRLERALVAHAREPWDSRWGAATEENLTAELKILAEESGFQLSKIQCRSSSCLVNVSWDDYEMGPEVYASITTSPLGLGCRVEMLPIEKGVREATAYLDCARARKAAESAVPMTASMSGPVPTLPKGVAEQRTP